MENKDILNALQNYEMTFGTAENIFSGGLLTDAERDFVMRDSNAFFVRVYRRSIGESGDRMVTAV